MARKGGDELNLIEKGKNYGWPIVAYGEEYFGRPIRGAVTARPGFEQPVYYWDPVIAPSGAQFYTGDAFPAWRGSLFVGGLEGQTARAADARERSRDRRGAPARRPRSARARRAAGSGRRAVRRHRRGERRALEDRTASLKMRSVACGTPSTTSNCARQARIIIGYGADGRSDEYSSRLL